VTAPLRSEREAFDAEKARAAVQYARLPWSDGRAEAVALRALADHIEAAIAEIEGLRALRKALLDAAFAKSTDEFRTTVTDEELVGTVHGLFDDNRENVELTARVAELTEERDHWEKQWQDLEANRASCCDENEQRAETAITALNEVLGSRRSAPPDDGRTHCIASVPGSAWDVIAKDRDVWKKRAEAAEKRERDLVRQEADRMASARPEVRGDG